MELTSIDFIVLCLMFGYSIVLGASNTKMRIQAFLTSRGYSQNFKGQVMDALLYGSTLYYILRYFEVVTL